MPFSRSSRDILKFGILSSLETGRKYFRKKRTRNRLLAESRRTKSAVKKAAIFSRWKIDFRRKFSSRRKIDQILARFPCRFQRGWKIDQNSSRIRRPFQVEILATLHHFIMMRFWLHFNVDFVCIGRKFSTGIWSLSDFVSESKISWLIKRFQ